MKKMFFSLVVILCFSFSLFAEKPQEKTILPKKKITSISLKKIDGYLEGNFHHQFQATIDLLKVRLEQSFELFTGSELFKELETFSPLLIKSGYGSSDQEIKEELLEDLKGGFCFGASVVHQNYMIKELYSVNSEQMQEEVLYFQSLHFIEECLNRALRRVHPLRGIESFYLEEKYSKALSKIGEIFQRALSKGALFKYLSFKSSFLTDSKQVFNQRFTKFSDKFPKAKGAIITFSFDKETYHAISLRVGERNCLFDINPSKTEIEKFRSCKKMYYRPFNAWIEASSREEIVVKTVDWILENYGKGKKSVHLVIYPIFN